MGQIRGQKEWQANKEGKVLTRKQAILALCYECNGFEESNKPPCTSTGCPIYPFRWKKRSKGGKVNKNAMLGLAKYRAERAKQG